jgi:hypothetical protein
MSHWVILPQFAIHFSLGVVVVQWRLVSLLFLSTLVKALHWSLCHSLSHYEILSLAVQGCHSLIGYSVPHDDVEDVPVGNHCLQTLLDKMDTKGTILCWSMVFTILIFIQRHPMLTLCIPLAPVLIINWYSASILRALRFSFFKWFTVLFLSSSSLVFASRPWEKLLLYIWPHSMNYINL